ncbi:hypothetical protein M3Y99_01332100 [Aphelenchoides fujianensis]|nr:hypothetical protein M3Y99_01332100 [Aphelenchoides fujianensis]
MPVITNQEMKMNADSLVGTTGLTERRVFAILHSIPAFHAARGDSEVKALKALCISEGKGFLSQVFKVVASFEDARRPAYSFILKLPIAAGLQQVIEKGKANGEENVVDQIVVDGHSNEVDFYTLANRIKGLPIAEAYAFEKIVPGQSNGLLAMQDLSELGEPLGFYRTANAEQTKNVAESIAKLQFWAENQPEFERWMRTLRVSIHLEEIITKYTSEEVMQELVNIPQIHAFLPKIKVVFDQAFSYFCLLDRPKELGGLAFCHGDTQPNNIIFKHGEKRELTAEVAAFIDWQLVVRFPQ